MVTIAINFGVSVIRSMATIHSPDDINVYSSRCGEMMSDGVWDMGVKVFKSSS